MRDVLHTVGSHFYYSLSVRLHSHHRRLGHIIYTMYLPGWTSSLTDFPFLSSSCPAQPCCLMSLPHRVYRYMSLRASQLAKAELLTWLDDLTNAALLPSNFYHSSMTVTTCCHARHFLPPLRILDFSPCQADYLSIPCPCYHRSCLLQCRLRTCSHIRTTHCSPNLRLSTLYHPPRTFSPSNRHVYNYFNANLCWVLSYDHPGISPFLCSLPPFHVQLCGKTHRGKDYAVPSSYAPPLRNSK